MKTVREALKDRKNEICFVSPTQTVFSAAEYMTEKEIGAVVVLEGTRVHGVLSERDIMNKVVSRGLNPHTVAVGEVMSMEVVYAAPDETTEECVVKMKTARCRHLPVIEDGHLLGMISLRDVLGLEVQDKEEKVELLDKYIWYLPPRMQDRQ